MGECAREDLGLTRKRAHAIVDAGHEQAPLAGDTERLVHDGLVVVDDIDSGELGEDLHERRENEAAPPLRHREHDAPPGDGKTLLGVDRRLDLVELVLDPFIVGAVVVQLVQDGPALFQAVRGDQVARRLGEPEHADGEQGGGQGLEGEREAPGEGGRLGDVVASVADPGGDDETDPNHLLSEADDETADLGMCDFGLVYGNWSTGISGWAGQSGRCLLTTHGQQSDREASDDAPYKHHGQTG